MNLQNYRLCELHFDEKYISRGGTRKTLFAQAVPTIFPQCSKRSIAEESKLEELPKKVFLVSGKPFFFKIANNDMYK